MSVNTNVTVPAGCSATPLIFCQRADRSNVTWRNDTRSIGSYAPAMNFNRTGKEHTMKSTATHKLVRVAALLGPAALVAGAAFQGGMHWSDETLKQDVTTLDGSLAKLRRL